MSVVTSHLYYSSVGSAEQRAERANPRTEKSGKMEQLTLKPGSQIKKNEVHPQPRVRIFRSFNIG